MIRQAHSGFLKVFQAWIDGKPCKVGNTSTNGKTLFSYSMPIAGKRGKEYVVLNKDSSPTKTTTKHIGLVQKELKLLPYTVQAKTVDKIKESDMLSSNDETTYRVVRKYYNEHDPVIKAEGLTLSEAREWVKNPETSSRTCTAGENCAHTEKYGPWFEVYEEE